jgi:formate-dependent nitrite reductase cytochrome c552 subunit
MPRQFCVKCNSYQNSYYDTCKERCGNTNDCRERCANCHHLFSGDLVKGTTELARIQRETQLQIAKQLAEHADRTGGRVEVIGSSYNTHIIYHPNKQC